MDDFPKIITKKRVFECPWISVVESKVRMTRDSTMEEAYYAIEQPDYVSIVAQIPDGRIPLVRQYRPAVASFTLELPAGTVDPEETPLAAAKRELLEETGVRSEEIISLGSFYADTGRLSNLIHVFFAGKCTPVENFSNEPGIEVLFLSPKQLKESIKEGRFKHQLHVGALLLATEHLADYRI